MLDEVYGAAACEKERLVVPGAQHGEAALVDPVGYWKTAEKFIGRYLQ